MYLYIWEDGHINKTTTEPQEDAFKACADGFFQLVRIDGEEPLEYAEGSWIPLDDI